jgi:heptose-I-phosphate ethanolaminephosphotransferase
MKIPALKLLRSVAIFLSLYGVATGILYLCGAPTRIAAVAGLGIPIMALPAWGFAILFPRQAAVGYGFYFAWAILWVVDFFSIGFVMARYNLSLESPVVTEALSNTSLLDVKEYLYDSWWLIIVMLLVTPILAWLLTLVVRLSARSVGPVRWHRGFVILAGLALIIVPIAYHGNPVVARADPISRWVKFYKKYQNEQKYRVLLVQSRKDAEKRLAAWNPHIVGRGPKTVVVVLGESSNRDDWSLYGYSRKTTPKLDALAGEMLVFRDAISSWGSSNREVTRIFSIADHEDEKSWSKEPDVLGLAKAAGYKTFWLTNQQAFYINTVFAKQADQYTLVNDGLGQRSDTSLDEKLLPELDKALADPAERKFIVIHTIGSHQHYQLRYPENFAAFDTVDDEVAHKMAAKWSGLVVARNQYDNTILYTDFILSSVIDRLKADEVKNSEMLYLADHGQEVGHLTDVWGHQLQLESGFTIPLILWLKDRPDVLARKSELEPRPYQTDRIDWMMLSRLDIATAFDHPEFDLTGDHFKPWQRVLTGRPYIPGVSHITLPKGGAEDPHDELRELN